MSGAGFEGSIGICNGWKKSEMDSGDYYILTHSGVIVQMNFNVAAYDTAQRSNQIIDLSRVGTPHRISNANSVDTNLVNGLIDREEVDKVGPEAVFR